MQIKTFSLFSKICLAVIVSGVVNQNIAAQKVHTSYLWHMDHPVYWADKSKDKPDSKQFV